MTVKSLPGILFIWLLLQSQVLQAQQCRVTNDVFGHGEEATYHIIYKWGLIWLEAGSVTFTVDTTRMLNRTVYHYVGEGGSYPKYDWIYKVRDRYEAWSDTSTLQPLRFKREVNEGGRYFIEDDFFVNNKAYVMRVDPRKPVMKDTIDLKPCTFDPLSAVYFARCIDFSQYRPGDKIPLNMFIDRSLTPVYVRYMGKEQFEMPDGTVYNTIKFKPLLIEGTIFRGGEHMTVWVTDDANRLPLYIESDILIGSVKAVLQQYSNLRSPVGAKVE